MIVEKDMSEQFALLSQKVDGMDKTLQLVATAIGTLGEQRFQQEQHGKDIAAQALHIASAEKDIDAAHRKVDEWLNRGRGAWWAAMGFGTILQLCVGGAIGYTFSHMRTAEDAVLLLTYRVALIEQQKVKP